MLKRLWRRYRGLKPGDIVRCRRAFIDGSYWSAINTVEVGEVGVVTHIWNYMDPSRNFAAIQLFSNPEQPVRSSRYYWEIIGD